jgi:hypothetical protein
MSDMASEASVRSKRANSAIATVVTLTMLAAAVALLVLEVHPFSLAEARMRFSIALPLLITVGAGVCWLVVRYRLAWFVAVPILATIVASAASRPVVASIALNAVFVTSLTLLIRGRYFGGVDERLTGPGLAACSGWLSAFAILPTLHALDREVSAWGAPLLLAVLATILWVRARAHASEGKEAAEVAAARDLNRRAYWGGFMAFGSVVAIIALMLLVAIILKLPYAGANSGSAAPGAWQPR